jgi:tetratricopeptide (TPR) repeat protein
MSLEDLNFGSSGKKTDDFFNSDFDSDLADVISKIRFRIRDLDELDEIKESYRNLINYSAGILKDCRKVLELEDSELDILVNKLESLVWRSNARAVLNRNDECEVELTKVLNLAPKEIVKEGCREFSQVKERVHAIQAAISNEQRILAKLSEYWEYSELDHILEEVKNFVEETRNYILNKKVERQLEILEQVASALTPSNRNLNLEDLVEEMRDQKLASTLVFSKLNSLCKATEQAKKHRGQLNLHKKQLKKFRDKISTNSAGIISLRDCFEMPRIKLDLAKEILNTLNSLPLAVKPQYQKEIDCLQQDLELNTDLDAKWLSFTENYQHSDLWKLKYSSGEIQSIGKVYNEILVMYWNGNFKDTTMEKKLSE